MCTKSERERGKELGVLFIQLLKAAEAMLKYSHFGAQKEVADLQRAVDAANESLNPKPKE